MSNRTRIAELAAAGHTAAGISRALGLASPTVDYHLRRLVEQVPAGTPVASPDTTRSSVETRGEVEALLEKGFSRKAIARRLGLSASTVSYHARRLGLPVDSRGARRYDWAAVQRYYDEGRSVQDCTEHFGFSRQTWHAAIKRGAVVARPQRIPLEKLFMAATPRDRKNLKRRLIEEGLKEARCEVCGLADWLGSPLSMALHHVNGDRHDNRLENLQMLCPNCHAQTESWGGRNPGRREVLQLG